MKKTIFLITLSILLFSFFQTTSAIQTATSHHPEKLIQSLKNAPQPGKKIYAEFCAVCHDQDPQIPLGAPRIGTPVDWIHRKKSLDEMTQSVIDGLNGMPPRGGCFECTDELLKAATQYLMSQEN